MDSRTRFRRVMEYQPVDRVPWLEEGLRDDVFERWRQQGMPAAGPDSVFTYDRRERIEINWGLRDPGVRGLVTRDELPAWRRNLRRPLAERLPGDWADLVARWKSRDHLLELQLHSGLLLTLGVGDWQALESAMYMLADEPDVVRELMELQGQLAATVARHVLEAVQPDMVSLSEPIGGNHGPLVGPAIYRALALPSYAPALALARAAEVPAIVFMTYANARALLHDVIGAGFNCLWAMETETHAMDYRDLRREFGETLRLIGGIDLDSLLSTDASAIAREIREKTPELLAEGGFIPLADGRVRASVPWSAYVRYRKLLEELTRPKAQTG